VLDFRVSQWAGSIAVGLAVFVVWILPDLVVPGWREGVLFSNGVVGQPVSSFAEAGRNDPVALALRFSRAALLVPVVEELFWRGWLPRWVIAPGEAEKVPLGTYSAWAFWATAVLFALEHGSYWEVGLLAGLAYNWWMRRTRRLGDLILSHAVTNACLSAYVIASGRWEYW
jgi:CAAX prenyl protease-like protein